MIRKLIVNFLCMLSYILLVELSARVNLTVRLLVAGTGTGTAELLGLAATGVGNEESSVVGDKLLLDLSLGGLVDELLVVGDDTLADGLSDGIDLRDITTTTDADADVDVLEDLIAEDEDGLEDLEAEDLGLDELDGAAVDADEALALLADGDCDRCSLATEALNVIHVS